jgi:hypothetical protein
LPSLNAGCSKIQMLTRTVERWISALCMCTLIDRELEYEIVWANHFHAFGRHHAHSLVQRFEF